MTFIRAKEIPPGSGNWYDYEVKSVWEHGHPRQKVVQYLGKSGVGHPSHGIPSESHVDSADFQSETTPVSTIPATPIENKARITKMKTPASQIASAMGMYYGGMSLDGIQQQFRQDHNLDMSESNYWNWVKRFTREAIRQAKDFQPVVGDKWVADETYMKLGKKTVYFWDIIDADSRFLLASHASFHRGAKDARELWNRHTIRQARLPRQ